MVPSVSQSVSQPKGEVQNIIVRCLNRWFYCTLSKLCLNRFRPAFSHTHTVLTVLYVRQPRAHTGNSLLHTVQQGGIQTFNNISFLFLFLPCCHTPPSTPHHSTLTSTLCQSASTLKQCCTKYPRGFCSCDWVDFAKSTCDKSACTGQASRRRTSCEHRRMRWLCF